MQDPKAREAPSPASLFRHYSPYQERQCGLAFGLLRGAATRAATLRPGCAPTLKGGGVERGKEWINEYSLKVISWLDHGISVQHEQGMKNCTPKKHTNDLKLLQFQSPNQLTLFFLFNF